jgi:hypothetical protein
MNDFRLSWTNPICDSIVMMIAARPVDEIHERVHQRGFAAGPRAGHQHQTIGLRAQGLDFRRQAELIGGDRTRQEHPEDDAGAAVVTEREASDPPISGTSHIHSTDRFEARRAVAAARAPSPGAPRRRPTSPARPRAR